jgi:GDP-D-mannose 3',5'-epimerase
LDWTDSRVLVTGGAGFIGSSLIRTLLSMGCKVRVADNFSRGTRENIAEVIGDIDLLTMDLTSQDNCYKACEGMDFVFHLAASVGGIQFIRRENVGGLTPSIQMNTNMLEAVRKNDIKRFVFASSACVYRERFAELNRFKESDAIPANPATTYGWAKLLGEIQCRAYHEDYGIKCSSARIFNAYGERENLDPRWSHVIPSLICKAINFPSEGFTIFGDGSQERAFLYVQDCVDGLIRFMEKLTKAEAVNLGSNDLVSIRELAERVIRISNKDITIKWDETGPTGTNRYCADQTLMRKVLDWIPATPLDVGLQRTYAWAKGVLDVE